jgi:3-hydroxyacyl-CoA dehydrogenase/enoyl-CoA hydratase/carnithine racemase
VTEQTLPSEIVTRALVRDVDLPGGAGRMALITLDNGRDHTRPSTFGPAGLAALNEAVDQVSARAEAGEIVAVGVTGKPFIFAAGADLTMVGAGRSRRDSLAIARLGHDVFRRFGELAVPTFAFVNGAALGGGVELPLHCTYRTVSSGVAAIALPECFLGLVPGWGGTYLLPNLVGPEKAVEVIVANSLNTNTMLNGAKAHALGLFDAIFEPADFLEQSLVWAAELLTGRRQVERTPVERDEQLWEGALKVGTKIANGKVHGAAPAPYRALELIRLARTADRDTAFEAESQALADLTMGDELRSSLYAFDLVNRRAKKPAGAPDKALARPVTSVGVVGAGLMASQLALLFVRRLQVPVVLTDLDQARVDKGVAYVHGEIDSLRAKKRITPDTANRFKALVTGSTSKEAFTEADLVIEAVFTLATVFAVGKELQKSCVLVKDAPAFVVNRLLTRFLGEVTRAVDEGTPVEVADRALAPLGLPMSPFVLLQLVGPAVALHVAETLHTAFPQRYHVTENLRRIVESGRAGIYSWDERGRPYVDDETKALLQQGDTVLTEEQVREKALGALAEETRLMLDDGVVTEAQDIDLCMILGAGWPFHLGGITPYLDRTGVAERVTGRRFLPRGVASVPG